MASRLTVSLLQSHDVEPRQCEFLSYGRRLERLSPEHIAPLLEELARHGAEGLWTILEITSIILLDGKKPPEPLIGILRCALIAPESFDQLKHGTRDGYNLKQTAYIWPNMILWIETCSGVDQTITLYMRSW
jgi:hypothetical protein